MVGRALPTNGRLWVAGRARRGRVQKGPRVGGVAVRDCRERGDVVGGLGGRGRGWGKGFGG